MIKYGILKIPLLMLLVLGFTISYGLNSQTTEKEFYPALVGYNSLVEYKPIGKLQGTLRNISVIEVIDLSKTHLHNPIAIILLDEDSDEIEVVKLLGQEIHPDYKEASALNLNKTN